MVSKELFVDGFGRTVEVYRFSFAVKMRHANGIILRKRTWWSKAHPYAKFPKHLRDPWIVR